jgi:DNA invertase Pin-like site-specific DNA recombinase
LQASVSLLGELHAKGVDLYLHQQGIDTGTSAGKAMFQMMGVFAEFERAMFVERLKSGVPRARSQGKGLGRCRKPRGNTQTHSTSRSAEVNALKADGARPVEIARRLGIGRASVYRVLAA